MNVRRLAIETLSKCETAAQYANLALDAKIKKYSLSGEERSLFTVLVYGTIERKLTLDYYIDALSNIPKEKIDTDTRNIIRLGLYQIIYMRTADHAAVNETVALAPLRSRGFVNALLRAYLRKKDSITLPSKEKEPFRALSVKYSFPEPSCRRFCEYFGVEVSEKLLEAMSLPSPLTLRVNTLITNRDDLIKMLNESGIKASATELAPNGIRLLENLPYSELEDKFKGMFFIQDEASQLATAALDARDGETVIDMCACPGSKSFGAAIDMNDKGRLLSFDISKNKLPLIASGAERLGINIISAAVKDGRTPILELFGQADRIICDVPCSGFGVLSKKPDIRYKEIAQTDALPSISYDILCNAARYLKVGGTLIYSTCTVLPPENLENIERFLSSHKNTSSDGGAEFELSPIKAGALSVDSGYITLMPHIHGTDGFFICKLRRIAPPKGKD